jgi:hypothetical protein
VEAALLLWLLPLEYSCNATRDDSIANTMTLNTAAMRLSSAQHCNMPLFKTTTFYA